MENTSTTIYQSHHHTKGTLTHWTRYLPFAINRNKSGMEPEVCQVNAGCGMVSNVQYLNFIDQNENEDLKH